MRKYFKLSILFGIMFILVGCYDHSYPKPSTLYMPVTPKLFSTQIDNKDMHITLATSTGSFKALNMQNYVFHFDAQSNQFTLEQDASGKEVSAGTYSYRITSVKGKQANLTLNAKKGLFIGRIITLSLWFRNDKSGILSSDGARKSGVLSGLFHITSA